ncbi:hypothetical protein GCM10027419_23160 [Pandoraea terrae]
MATPVTSPQEKIAGNSGEIRRNPAAKPSRSAAGKRNLGIGGVRRALAAPASRAAGGLCLAIMGIRAAGEPL